jgi:hypothetical protein
MKCNLCEYMKNGGFPFNKINNVIYLDTEDCYDDGIECGYIKVEYCLKCGKKINTFEIS